MEPSRLQWLSAEADPGKADRLVAELGVPRPTAVALVARGFDEPTSALEFLRPRLSRLTDPFLLPGMQDAVRRILEGVKARQAISVFGDYDADGLTSTALLVSVLRRLGGRVQGFVPDRVQDGYGFSIGALQRCIEQQSPQLIVTADCGTHAVEAVAHARSAGIDVVVTDHHEVSHEPVSATAVLNPKLGGPRETASLAGVGVVFKLCHALLKQLMADGEADASGDLDLRSDLDLVALGTVCDIVPLLDENRILVRHGLRRLGQDGGAVGLCALREVAGVSPPLSCYDLGFLLGPRLNAAGRIGSASPALDLLLTSDPDMARERALDLDAANRERQRIEQEILDEAMLEIDGFFDPESTFGLVVGRAGWDIGVVGIVAARLCRHYNRPAVVIGFDGNGAGRGSCRSRSDIDMLEVLRDCAASLTSFGGHKAAAGISIMEDQLDTFSGNFNSVCARFLRGRDLRPTQRIDAWLTHLGEADERLMQTIDQMRPLGTGNPAPIWGIRQVRVVGPPRRVGRDGAHLKMTIASGGSQLDAIAFGLGDVEIPSGPVDLLFELDRNEFRGRTSLQLKVKDLRKSDMAERETNG